MPNSADLFLDSKTDGTIDSEMPPLMTTPKKGSGRGDGRGGAQKRPNLEGVARSHPVIPIVLAMNNRTTNASLPDFLEYELQHTTNNQIPMTMAELYHDYVQYSIQRQLRAFREQYGPQHYRWNVNDAIRGLASMAFVHFVRNTRITHSMVTKLMGGVGLETSFDSTVDLELRTFGLLVQDGVVGRQPVYRFKEQLIEEYLVARHLLHECIRKIVSGREERILHGAVYEAMKRLPATGDIWRMTFALLNDDMNTRNVQGCVLSELIDIAKTIDGLSSFDVTSMCIEAIYESRNAALLTEHIDEFSMNETVNYSNAFVPKSRLQYVISAAGYFVRASENVYGLHMSNFGLTSERVALLADPVNAVSDNHLQVLNVSRNSLGREGMCRLQRFIVKATFLTHLDMSECELGCGGIAILSEYFMCLPLVYLNLSDNDIGDKGMLRMLKNLHYLETLEWLDLSCNQLTDASMAQFGESLTALRNLRSLDLRHNDIGDAAIMALSRTIVHLPRLANVMLAQNLGEDQSASQLVDQAWKSKSLRHISLNLNTIPPEGILGLRRVTLSRDHMEMPSMDESGMPGDSEPEDSIMQSTTLTLNDSQDVSFHVMTPWDLDKSASMDLLAGRPDRTQAVQLRRRNSSRASASLPRMKDVRRSWHGMNASFRDGVRETRDSLRGGESFRERLSRTGSNLQQSFRNSTSNLRKSLRRSNSRLSERFGSRRSEKSQASVVEEPRQNSQEDTVSSMERSVDSETWRRTMYSETAV